MTAPGMNAAIIIDGFRVLLKCNPWYPEIRYSGSRQKARFTMERKDEESRRKILI